MTTVWSIYMLHFIYLCFSWFFWHSLFLEFPGDSRVQKQHHFWQSLSLLLMRVFASSWSVVWILCVFNPTKTRYTRIIYSEGHPKHQRNRSMNIPNWHSRARLVSPQIPHEFICLEMQNYNGQIFFRVSSRSDQKYLAGKVPIGTVRLAGPANWTIGCQLACTIRQEWDYNTVGKILWDPQPFKDPQLGSQLSSFLQEPASRTVPMGLFQRDIFGPT